MTGAIFDMDGLLIDSERIFQRIWRELAAEAGVILDDTFAEAMCGSSGKVTEAVLRRYVPGVDPQALIAECYRRVIEVEKKYIPLKPGTVEILEGMKRCGFRTALASSSPLDMIERNLEITDLAAFFDELISGTEVRHGKPEPDIFLLAAGRLGLPARDCYVFEDSVNGIRAGIAAGCMAVMVPDLVQPTPEVRALCHGVYPDLSAAWRAISEEQQTR